VDYFLFDHKTLQGSLHQSSSHTLLPRRQFQNIWSQGHKQTTVAGLWPSLVLTEEHRMRARLHVLTAASMRTTVFWDIAPCSLVEMSRRFRGVYYLNFQHDLPDDTGRKHLWNVEKFLQTIRRNIPEDSRLHRLRVFEDKVQGVTEDWTQLLLRSLNRYNQGDESKVYKSSVTILEWNRPFGGTKSYWHYNINRNMKEIHHDWIKMAHRARCCEHSSTLLCYTGSREFLD
jgi:hypothetical protein